VTSIISRGGHPRSTQCPMNVGLWNWHKVWDLVNWDVDCRVDTINAAFWIVVDLIFDY